MTQKDVDLLIDKVYEWRNKFPVGKELHKFLNKNLEIGIGNSIWFTYDYSLLDTHGPKRYKYNTKNIYNFLMNDGGGALTNDIEDSPWIPTHKKLQNYNSYNQHQRPKLRVPDYGQLGKDLSDPTGTSGSFMEVYQAIGDTGMIDPIWEVNQLEYKAIDDFVKFMFHDLNTNERFRFRAYIENVSENYNPSWQEVKVLGRADSPYIYQGFERTLGVSFKVAALSRGDLLLMWDQLERLGRTTVPQYQNNFKMKGPLIKFTLANWFINMPAFVKSLSYTVDNDTPWEINMEGSELYGKNANSDNVGELPLTVSVQIDLQIFGEVRPESYVSSNDIINTPAGIDDGLHYSKGDLYPLGEDGLRGDRQSDRFGNKDKPPRPKRVSPPPPPKKNKDDNKKDDNGGGGGGGGGNTLYKPLNINLPFQTEKVDKTYVAPKSPYVKKPRTIVMDAENGHGGANIGGTWDKPDGMWTPADEKNHRAEMFVQTKKREAEEKARKAANPYNVRLKPL